MPKYAVTARVVGSKFIGEFEANSEAEAIKLAEASGAAGVSLCHQCSDECEDPECDEMHAHLVEAD